MNDLIYRTATDLAGALRARRVSSRELVEAFIARRNEVDGDIGAVVTADDDGARAAADAADRALADERPTGPLCGVPITVKDTFETAGLRTTAGGFEPLAEHVPAADAVSVARLRAAGAVVLGKTNAPQLAGDVQSYNPIFGVTRNPWDGARTCGGSSGGAQPGA